MKKWMMVTLGVSGVAGALDVEQVVQKSIAALPTHQDAQQQVSEAQQLLALLKEDPLATPHQLKELDLRLHLHQAQLQAVKQRQVHLLNQDYNTWLQLQSALEVSQCHSEEAELAKKIAEAKFSVGTLDKATLQRAQNQWDAQVLKEKDLQDQIHQLRSDILTTWKEMPTRTLSPASSKVATYLDLVGKDAQTLNHNLDLFRAETTLQNLKLEFAAQKDINALTNSITSKKQLGADQQTKLKSQVNALWMKQQALQDQAAKAQKVAQGLKQTHDLQTKRLQQGLISKSTLLASKCDLLASQNRVVGFTTQASVVFSSLLDALGQADPSLKP